MAKVTLLIGRLFGQTPPAPETEPVDAASLRAAWREEIGRMAQVQATYRCAHRDADFLGNVSRGDAARDAGDWVAAEAHYRRALADYPLHPGYRIQLGHMLKEQGKFAAAELCYRTAWALGEGADLLRHLAFVCDKQGVPAADPPAPADAEELLDCAPTMMDLELLAWLLWTGEEVEAADLAPLMRRHATRRAAILAMIADPRFVPANQTFLEILAEAPV